ncbi:hypothetical protein [Aneurinibacillus tyrosinisolvens]|uniref:hypothetical protein n=1 Tax=Aneurinibacillus tyrosinisolvens TaxID=1443435 RepID=UPI00063F9EF2|nr:hypothetical protein [Aneurinibacillus tyrosinisolvens]
MKKAIFIFLAVYILAIGGYYLYKNYTATEFSNEGKPHLERSADYHEGMDLQWDVENGKNGNYVPVDFESYKHMSQEEFDESHDMHQLEGETIPNDRLMNVFDLANRDYSQEAFAVFDIRASQPDVADPNIYNNMDQFLARSIQTITHNKTLKTVRISNPKTITPTQMTYDLRVEYRDGKIVEIAAVPMIKVEMDWYVNMRFSDFVNKFR